MGGGEGGDGGEGVFDGAEGGEGGAHAGTLDGQKQPVKPSCQSLSCGCRLPCQHIHDMAHHAISSLLGHFLNSRKVCGVILQDCFKGKVAELAACLPSRAMLFTQCGS